MVVIENDNKELPIPQRWQMTTKEQVGKLNENLLPQDRSLLRNLGCADVVKHRRMHTD